MSGKKRIFSGAQPSGSVTLGNFLGAIKNWVELQDKYDCIYCIVDLHALTVRQDPKVFRERCYSFLAQYLACGLDPEKNVVYFQSHVSAHAELAWILNCYTYMGELSRMTQFKEKARKHQDNINAGLFTYPVLMAADILLFQTDLVPVGEDQKQHVELTRDIATRFNNLYGEVFKIPEPYIPEVGARIMSLLEPTKKMSKSDENENSYILLLDPPDVIMKKFKRAVTDSEAVVRYDVERKPGISNLMNIYAAVTGRSFEEIEREFEGKGYGEFKKAVAEVVIDKLRPIREKYDELMANKDYMESVIKNGAERAQELARETLKKVYDKIGLVPCPNTGLKGPGL
ncbi:tryptophan--tRNA ligase [Thermosediminibacter oceani]|uniref:Tryptophan--tRNA ligase n=1 Tax=Thermosediminibacter oceani (strain ATCC BAA-1034 / DSM 16646 / JW/IW-1228P) TaxID=555079 RepID=D9S0B7_THEOJ|nr:tryptophan--tRNA ligase [Thermosediminibacter oceani]ADL07045.1 tryptophanyl-tRNA synthetase [Thermosediminibacter oceani DSM 16646]